MTINKKKSIAPQILDVIFGVRTGDVSDLPKNHILIVPAADNWNDFGHKSRVIFYVNFTGKHEVYSFSAYLGFITNSNDELNGVNRIDSMLESNSDLTVAVSEKTRMFTMLPNMEAYRNIVSVFGPEDAKTVLRSVRDLVVLTEFKKKTNWLNSAISSDIFNKSFIRSSESYFAFKNAGSILRGLGHERLQSSSQSLGIRFQLPGRGGEHDLDFKFDHHPSLPKKIAVLIGKNGVGKSQTLGRIAQAALIGDRALIDTQTFERPAINRVLAFAPTNEARSVFPSGRMKRPRVWYRRFSLNRNGSPGVNESATDLIVQVARSEELIKNVARWDIFMKAISAIDNWHQICLPLAVGNGFAELEGIRHGGEQKLLERFGSINLKGEPSRVIDGKGYPLSSGEISFLRFAAQASLYIENGSLLLLDEPETHLHPNFISQLVLLLENLLEKTGSCAIIATHSAYFVREVFSDQVTVLSINNEGMPVAERPALSTFGANVGAISYFVFGEDEPSRLAAKVENKLLRKFKTWEELYARYKDELSLETLGSLRATMEKRGQE